MIDPIDKKHEQQCNRCQELCKEMNTKILPQDALTAVGELNVASVPPSLMLLFLFVYAWSKSLMYPSTEDNTKFNVG